MSPFFPDAHDSDRVWTEWFRRTVVRVLGWVFWACMLWQLLSEASPLSH